MFVCVCVPLTHRVGDTIKFGSSSRLWVLCGPAELLPPEGLTKSQKKQLAQLEYSAKVANKEKEVRVYVCLRVYMHICQRCMPGIVAPAW